MWGEFRFLMTRVKTSDSSWAHCKPYLIPIPQAWKMSSFGAGRVPHLLSPNQCLSNLVGWEETSLVAKKGNFQFVGMLIRQPTTTEHQNKQISRIISLSPKAGLWGWFNIGLPHVTLELWRSALFIVNVSPMIKYVVPLASVLGIPWLFEHSEGYPIVRISAP